MITTKAIILTVFIVVLQALLSTARFFEDDLDKIMENDWSLADEEHKRQAQCEDVDEPQCLEWKSYGYCTKRYLLNKMKKECRKTCGYCSTYCRDKEAIRCAEWEKKGYCDNPLPQIRSLMKEYCSKTCKLCVKAAASKCALASGSKYGCCWDGTEKIDAVGSNCKACKDAEKFALHVCGQFKSSCDNGGITEQWLSRYCPKTCALCGHEGDECIDREQRLCTTWEERGYCDSENVDVKNRMIKYCAKTCGICNPIEIKRK